MPSSFRFLPVLIVLFALPLHALHAKRAAPDPVPPVTVEGITYSAPNQNGRSPSVVATRASDGQKLWEQPIFTNTIDPLLEEDVQWVFIKKMEFDGKELRITDEHGHTYFLNPRTMEVSGADKLSLNDFPVWATVAMIAVVALLFTLVRNWYKKMVEG